MPILYDFRSFSQIKINPSNSRELYLSTEYADIALDFRLQGAHDLTVGIVIEVDDGTLWKSSPSRLVVYRVGGVELKDGAVLFDSFRTVILEASRPSEDGRIDRCLFVVSPASLSSFHGPR